MYGAAGAAPILVVGGRRDPATPYEWSVGLSSGLESGVLLTYDGDGHAALGKNDCVDAYAVAYLVDLTVPPDGTECANTYGGDTFPGPGDGLAGFVPPPAPEPQPVVQPPAPAPAPIKPPDTGSRARSTAGIASILGGLLLVLGGGGALAVGGRRFK